MHANSQKRLICPKCRYPKKTCLCKHVRPISSPVNVLILQDPSEAKHHKNTVKLLSLCISNIQVMTTSSVFDLSDVNPSNGVVIYPSSTAFCMEDMFLKHSLSTQSQAKALPEQVNPANKHGPDFNDIKYLIFLDGSWSKTHKIWSTFPFLHALPQMTFAKVPVSQYRIRKANKKNSLSTLEACAYVLDYLYQVDTLPLYSLLNALQEDWDAHKNREIC